MEYNKVWTRFETQALAFSLLRKNLYPEYWIRGDYKLGTLQADIAIFKPAYPPAEPVLKLILQVKASNASHTNNLTNDAKIIGDYKGTPILEIIGGEAAYNVRNMVQPYL